MAEHFFSLHDRQLVAEGTMAFWFSTDGADFVFTAGQNGDFTIIDPPKTDAKGMMRTFSFASSPNEKNRIMIATRMRDSAFKSVLRDMPIGTKLKVDGPMGNMILHEDSSKPAVFLTGGIGITPMRSIIASATEDHKPHELILLYSNRTAAGTAFLDDLLGWQAKNPRLRVVATLTDEDDTSGKFLHGRIDEALVRQYVSDVTAPVYYLAGPPAMVDAMQAMLAHMGVSRDNIRFESFSGY